MAKRGGHLTNYLGSPWQLNKSLKLDNIRLAEEFQEIYFARFSGIRRWHHEVQEQLQQTAQITTVFGRRRTFFGRRNDDATLRKAVAYLPQSTIVDTLDFGMLRAWYTYELGGDERLQALLQEHDGFVFQYWETDKEIVALVEDCMACPLPIHGRTLTIPVATKVGYAWTADLMAGSGTPKALAQVRPQVVDMLDWKVG
jgi:DNA polymerase I-like protein with 3'-5' exonuclease and polymerase domains